MNKMRKRPSVSVLLLASFLGGVIALFGKELFFEKSQKSISTTYKRKEDLNPVSLTNYVFDSASFVVPEGLNFVFAAKRSTPSVVHIRTTFEEGISYANPFHKFFKDYFGEEYERRGYGRAEGAGSGVIISKDGYIITNHHVINNATEIKVVLTDNRSYKAEIIGEDKATDLAIIKIDEKNLIPIVYGESETLNIGEWVLAIGNPFEFRSTVTAGIVSAKGRNINILRGDYRIESFIQTDAVVNPGNSGGALVNLNGELVGINTAIASHSGVFSGYSFAVPVTLVKKVASDIMEFGTVQRALLGIRIQNVNAELADRYKLSIVKGVYVADVAPDGAAENAGIKIGDVIVSVAGHPVNNVGELQERIAVHHPGNKVKVGYVRKGKNTKHVEVVLRDSYGTVSDLKFEERVTLEGAVFIEVSEKLKQELSVEGGVQITSISEGRWKAAGIKKGFIIIKVAERSIGGLEDFVDFITDVPRKDGILIEGYYPDGNKAYYGLEF